MQNSQKCCTEFVNYTCIIFSFLLRILSSLWITPRSLVVATSAVKVVINLNQLVESWWQQPTLPQCVAPAVCSCLHAAGTKTSPRAVGYVSFPPPLKFPFLLGSEPPILFMVPWAYARLHTSVPIIGRLLASLPITGIGHLTIGIGQ